MAPIPDAWPGHVSSMKAIRGSDLGNAVSVQSVYKVNPDNSVDFKTSTAKLNYRTLRLDPGSPLYQSIKTNNSTASAEYLATITSMKYTVDIKGTAPSDNFGYPLYVTLHGGGGKVGIRNTDRAQTDAEVVASNDSLWYDMTTYYALGVETGVCVALRGIGDVYNLFSQPATYALIERLIENMVMFQAVSTANSTLPAVSVNPNQVYLFGFSAGGDGVYQIAPRLSQRLAAANMSAGHPGGVSFVNLMNLPMCLQVGEEDTDYDRSYHAADYGDKLDTLQNNNTSIYIHDVFIHPRGDHNDWEGGRQVIDKPNEWKGKYNLETHKPTLGMAEKTAQTTSAVQWAISKGPRNPTPAHIAWDLTTRADGLSKPGQHYWLDIGAETTDTLGVDLLDAAISSNTVTVATSLKGSAIGPKKPVRILLRSAMPDATRAVDLSKAIQVKLNGTNLNLVTPGTNVDSSVLQSTLARNDPNLAFTNAIYIIPQGGSWVAMTSLPSPAPAPRPVSRLSRL